MWSIISFVISFIAICLIVWMLIVPVPLKLIIKYIYPNSNYDANKNATIKPQYTLYSSDGSRHDKLIVLFIGGALLTSNVSNCYGICNYINETLGNEYDILAFNYHVRFKYSLHETMLDINEKLRDFLHYDSVHAIGISFGALLAGAFYQKESSRTIAEQMNIPQIGMEFKSFSAISGLFEPTFNVDILTRLFRFYIMRNTPSILNYTCYRMKIPKLILNTKSDFLLSQTAKLIQSEPCDYYIYDSTTLPHPFVQYINLSESRDALDRICKFIKGI